MRDSRIFNRSEKDVADLYSIFPPYEIVQVAWTFAQAYNIYATSFAMTLKNKRLTISQWIALIVLFITPKPVTPTRIKSFIPIETPSVSSLLDRLEERKLIVRKRSKTDKRKVDLYLTEGGYRIIKEVTPFTDELLLAVYGTLSKQKRQALMSITRELRNNCLAFFGIDRVNADTILDKFINGASIDGYTLGMEHSLKEKRVAADKKRITRRKL